VVLPPPDGHELSSPRTRQEYEDIYPLNFQCETGGRSGRNARRHPILVPTWRPMYGWAIRTPAARLLGWMIARCSGSSRTRVLAEAFTRPKVMKALAKAGFSQSYTYFTWRNEREEIEEYLTENHQPPVAEYFRGNLFVEHPDILPEVL